MRSELVRVRPRKGHPPEAQHCMVGYMHSGFLSFSLLFRNIRRVFPFCVRSQSLQDELGYEAIAQIWRDEFWHKMGVIRF